MFTNLTAFVSVVLLALSVSGSADTRDIKRKANYIEAGSLLLPLLSDGFEHEVWIDEKPSVDTSMYLIKCAYRLNFETMFYADTITLDKSSRVKNIGYDIISGTRNNVLRLQYNAVKSEESSSFITLFSLGKDIHPDTPVTHLLFWVRSDTDNQSLAVAFWNDNKPGEPNITFADVSHYTPITHEWKLVSIPLRDTGYHTDTNNKPCISFLPFNTDATGYVYIDDIRLCRLEPKNTLDTFQSSLTSSLGTRPCLEKSRHFYVYSDYTPYLCFHSARCCEMVYDDLCVILGNSTPLEYPVLIGIFANRSAFSRFMTKLGYGQQNVRGIYLTGSNYSFIGSYFDENYNEAAVYANLVHETAHLVLHSYFESIPIPLWLDEGIAQYYEFNTYEYGNIDRKQKEKRIQRVTKIGACKLTALLDSFNEEYNNEVFTVSEKYLYAYSFVTFLYKSYAMTGLISQIKAGKTPHDALRHVFKASLDDIEKQWQSFIANKADAFK